MQKRMIKKTNISGHCFYFYFIFLKKHWNIIHVTLHTVRITILAIVHGTMNLKFHNCP